MGEIPGGWQQQAAFSVFFDVSGGAGATRRWRTRAYHEETGDEITVTETDPNAWVEWIRQHLRTGPIRSHRRSVPLSAITVQVASVRSPSPPGTGGEGEPVAVRVELAVGGLTELARTIWAGWARALRAGR